MSVLDGLAGVGLGFAGAGQAIASRRDSDRRERQLVLNEEEGARLATAERERLDVNAANGTMTLIHNAGFFNDTMTRIDGKKLAAGLEAGDAQARSVALGIARSNRLIDPSVKDARWTKGPNDEWVIQTSNEDGSFGVITLDGSSDPDSPVASFKTLEDFVNVTNEALANTLKYQTKFDNAAALEAEGIVTADYAGLEDAIAGLPQEQQVATKRGVIATAANIDDPAEKQKFIDSVASGEPPAESVTPAPQTLTMEPEAESGSRQIGRNRKMREGLASESEAEPEYQQIGRNRKMREGLDARKEGRIKKAPEELAKEKERLAKLEGQTGRLAISARQVSQGKIARLENEIAELEPATFIMDTPEQQASVDKVVEETKDMSTEQVVEKVMSGEINITPQEQAQVATQLQQAGVETVADLANLKNSKDRAMARVAMIAAIGGGKNPNQTKQNELMREINNIFETGTASMSANDATAFGIQQDRLALGTQKFLRLVERDYSAAREEAALKGATFLRGLGKVKEEGVLTMQGVQNFLPTLAPYLLEIKGAPPEARSLMLSALNPAFSEILATLAAEEKGGFSETLKSIFRGDADPSSISKTDFNLSRVEGKFNSDGKFEGFYYTGPAERNPDGSRKRGRRKDELVLANDIQRLDSRIYNVLVLAAQANAKDQPLSTSDVADVVLPRARQE